MFYIAQRVGQVSVAAHTVTLHDSDSIGTLAVGKSGCG
jgi:hypothetical protein